MPLLKIFPMLEKCLFVIHLQEEYFVRKRMFFAPLNETGPMSKIAGNSDVTSSRRPEINIKKTVISNTQRCSRK